MVPPNQAPPAPPDPPRDGDGAAPGDLSCEAARADWVKVEVTLNIGGRITSYSLEGVPDGALPEVIFQPDFPGGPHTSLTGMGVDIDMHLGRHTMIVSNEEAPQLPPPWPLRAVGE